MYMRHLHPDVNWRCVDSYTVSVKWNSCATSIKELRNLLHKLSHPKLSLLYKPMWMYLAVRMLKQHQQCLDSTKEPKDTNLQNSLVIVVSKHWCTQSSCLRNSLRTSSGATAWEFSSHVTPRTKGLRHLKTNSTYKHGGDEDRTTLTENNLNTSKLTQTIDI